MRKVLVCCLMLEIALAYPGAASADAVYLPVVGLPPTARPCEIALVTCTIDGDTFDAVLDTGETARVRPLCWDAPETRGHGHCYAQEAKHRLEALVIGQVVVLTKDTSECDQFGRLLRHVYVVGNWVGAEMVRGGYARTKMYEPDTRLCWLLWQYQAEAETAGAGGWSECEVWPDW